MGTGRTRAMICLLLSYVELEWSRMPSYLGRTVPNTVMSQIRVESNSLSMSF